MDESVQPFVLPPSADGDPETCFVGIGGIGNAIEGALAIASGAAAKTNRSKWTQAPQWVAGGTVMFNDVDMALPALAGEWACAPLQLRAGPPRAARPQPNLNPNPEVEPAPAAPYPHRPSGGMCGGMFWSTAAVGTSADAAALIRCMEAAGAGPICNQEPQEVLAQGIRFLGRYSWSYYRNVPPELLQLPEAPAGLADDLQSLEQLFEGPHCFFVPGSTLLETLLPPLRAEAKEQQAEDERRAKAAREAAEQAGGANGGAGWAFAAQAAQAAVGQGAGQAEDEVTGKADHQEAAGEQKKAAGLRDRSQQVFAEGGAMVCMHHQEYMFGRVWFNADGRCIAMACYTYATPEHFAEIFVGPSPVCQLERPPADADPGVWANWAAGLPPAYLCSQLHDELRAKQLHTVRVLAAAGMLSEDLLPRDSFGTALSVCFRNEDAGQAAVATAPPFLAELLDLLDEHGVLRAYAARDREVSTIVQGMISTAQTKVAAILAGEELKDEEGKAEENDEGGGAGGGQPVAKGPSMESYIIKQHVCLLATDMVVPRPWLAARLLRALDGADATNNISPECGSFVGLSTLMQVAERPEAAGEVIEQLLAAGANPLLRLPAPLGWTALAFAAKAGNGAAVERLLAVTPPEVVGAELVLDFDQASRLLDGSVSRVDGSGGPMFLGGDPLPPVAEEIRASFAKVAALPRGSLVDVTILNASRALSSEASSLRWVLESKMRSKVPEVRTEYPGGFVSVTHAPVPEDAYHDELVAAMEKRFASVEDTLKSLVRAGAAPKIDWATFTPEEERPFGFGGGRTDSPLMSRYTASACLKRLKDMAAALM